jgi:hypothetical protein
MRPYLFLEEAHLTGDVLKRPRTLTGQRHCPYGLAEGDLVEMSINVDPY